MKQTLVETYNDFISFLKNPVEQKDPIQTVNQKTKRFFALLLLDITVAFIVIGIFYAINIFVPIDKVMEQYMEDFYNLPIWLIFLSAVVIAPLWEELVFRLPLRYKYNYLARFIIFISGITGRQNKIKVKYFLRNFSRKHFRFIFYFFAILFGLIHITNYEFSLKILLLLPILTFSQFFGGLCMGYLRVKYNLILAIIFHAVYNAIIVSIVLIAMTFPTEKLNIENENYRIKIEEVSSTKKLNTYLPHDADSVVIKGATLKTVIAYLTDKNEILIETNNPKLLNTKINLDFVSYSLDVSENKNTILSHLSQLYNFEIVSKVGTKEVWKLQVKDFGKLSKHKTQSDFDAPILSSTVGDKIEITNANLTVLATNLTQHFDRYFIYENDLLNRYDFEISTKDFHELIGILSSEYGISLRCEGTELDYISVEF